MMGIISHADAKKAANAALVCGAPKMHRARWLLDGALGSLKVVVLQLGFVAVHLPVQLVYQLVHRSVQVGVAAFGKRWRPSFSFCFSILSSTLMSTTWSKCRDIRSSLLVT
jgi:hypothetical protein